MVVFKLAEFVFLLSRNDQSCSYQVSHCTIVKLMFLYNFRCSSPLLVWLVFTVLSPDVRRAMIIADLLMNDELLSHHSTVDGWIVESSLHDIT